MIDNNNGKLIIFSAPSGAGKTTLVKNILAKNENIVFSISATTRECRGNEKDGVDYYFLTQEEFEKKISNNEFIEYEEVYSGTYYGTLKKEIERIWNLGKHVIFDVDVVGGLNLKKNFGDKALSIFVKPPTVETLRERLTHRGTDTSENVMKRLSKAAHELSFENRFDKVILNDTLERAFNESENLIDTFISK